MFRFFSGLSKNNKSGQQEQSDLTGLGTQKPWKPQYLLRPVLCNHRIAVQQHSFGFPPHSIKSPHRVAIVSFPPQMSQWRKQLSAKIKHLIICENVSAIVFRYIGHKASVKCPENTRHTEGLRGSVQKKRKWKQCEQKRKENKDSASVFATGTLLYLF